MRRSPVALVLAVVSASPLVACGGSPPTPVQSAAPTPATPFTNAPATPLVQAPSTEQPRSGDPVMLVAAPKCTPADWTPRELAPLLSPGKTPSSSRPERQGAAQLVFDQGCTDAPNDGLAPPSAAPVVIDGVQVRVTAATPAGTSGRGWQGNRCTFELRLADGSGVPVTLGAPDVPPLTTVSALVRADSAVWVSLSFNGYTREFPQGGNRIIALDLCDGRIAWRSKDSMSNGGLLLLDDYLVSPYGFTGERRFVYVLDAHSGRVVQKLPVIENVCPSKSWAPNWHPGERCDAPGQAVGAATAPRVEGGVFLVDTNTGSSAFAFR